MLRGRIEMLAGYRIDVDGDVLGRAQPLHRNRSFDVPGSSNAVRQQRYETNCRENCRSYEMLHSNFPFPGFDFFPYRTSESSKYEVSPDNKSIGTEKSNCSGDWLLEAPLILKRQLDIGADKHLNPWAKAGPRSRARNPVQEIRRRIHNVVAHQADQPRISPVFGLRKTAAKRNGRRGYKACSTGIESFVGIVPVHPEPP